MKKDIKINGVTMEDMTGRILSLTLKEVPELRPYFNEDGSLKSPLNTERTHHPLNYLP